MEPFAPLLAPSLAAARRAGVGGVNEGEAVKAQQWLPFDQQIPVGEEERMFHIVDHVFVGSEFGASDRALLDALNITAVINVTAGSRRVPNHFDGAGIDYIHYELFDQPGADPSEAARGGADAISRWGADSRRVLVHCSAGLSRSVTVVLAWLMETKSFDLAEAVALVDVRRGRRVQCNPSFWCFLAALERRLRSLAPGTPPSLDFTPWFVDDFSRMGFDKDRVRQLLQAEADWVHFDIFFEALLG
eukprot:TRINITY_DN28057_c0_g1_i1.p1 TRINITY_DN28057_c0_g1~~TRINITY_DN28057_c0_g1_i1.p1  ORF type:complete len:286 (-),score=33.32 TRINITY_DN28057_c0_g1_i1:44-781(-)